MKQILRKTIKRATTPTKTISVVIRAGRIARIRAQRTKKAKKFAEVRSAIESRIRRQRNLAKSIVKGETPWEILKNQKQAKDILRRLRTKQIDSERALKEMLVLVKRQ
ncbi:MAG: hypothetical protein WC462_00305 [archaeon]